MQDHLPTSRPFPSGPPNIGWRLSLAVIGHLQAGVWKGRAGICSDQIVYGAYADETLFEHGTDLFMHSDFDLLLHRATSARDPSASQRDPGPS
jgi:hypothetical protein